ncbi:hypothetical protein P3T17_007573 [Paraburkholderia sp. GAS82]
MEKLDFGEAHVHRRVGRLANVPCFANTPNPRILDAALQTYPFALETDLGTPETGGPL